jgi:hypothetical protein
MPRNGSGLYILPAGNPVVTQTVIRSSWANPTMADVALALTNSISKDGQTTPVHDLPMGGFRHTGVGLAVTLTQYARVDQVQDGSIIRCISEAGGDAYTGLLPFGQTVFKNGQMIGYKFPATNTTLTPTLNINASAPWPILRQDGSSVLPGDCKTNVPSLLIFNDTSWLLLGSVGGGGGGGVSSVNGKSGVVTLTYADLEYVPMPIAGGTFTGAVTLAGPASAPLQPATLQQLLDATTATVAGVASFTGAGAPRTGAVTLTSADVTTALGYVPTQSYNGRTGAVVPQPEDVIAALGYVPANKAGQIFTGAVVAPALSSSGPVSGSQFRTVVQDDGASGAAKAIDFSIYSYHKLLMTGNCVLSFTAPAAACVLHMEMVQDATGNRVMTLPALVKWPAAYSATDKALTTAANARDLLILKFNGVDYVANLVKGIG